MTSACSKNSLNSLFLPLPALNSIFSPLNQPSQMSVNCFMDMQKIEKNKKKLVKKLFILFLKNIYLLSELIFPP